MTHIRDFEPTLPDPQPFVEKALALYERARREKRGSVLFITAELGGGKTEILNALAKALHEAKPAPNFIAGYFSGGDYNPYKLSWQENIPLKKAITAVSGIASLLGLLPTTYAFAATFIGQLIGTSVSASEFAEELKKSPQLRHESADWLKKLLRHAAEDGPLVCLLDDWDQAQRFYWDSMLFSLAREITQELPILLFITVKEPFDLDTHEKDGTELAPVISSMIEKGLARRWPLQKLTQAEVASAIGEAAPGIASKLHGVTGGNARWVRELWYEWRLNGIVTMNESDRWVWGEHLKETINLYKDIVEDRLMRLLKEDTTMDIEEAREVLACAALEGVRFTADAVAAALNWERDELIDFLDDVLVQTQDNPDGLLLEDGSINLSMPDGTTRTLWLYSFVSDLHWMAMEHYGFVGRQRPGKAPERFEKSAALIGALMQTYSPEERLVAAKIARLLQEIGHDQEAQPFQRMADYASGREVMREQALYLTTINKDDWEQWQCGRAAIFLIEAGRVMFDVFPHSETLAVCEEARKLARRAKYRSDEALALNLHATVLYAEGKRDAAEEKVKDALRINQQIGNRRGEANSKYVLAKIKYNGDNFAEARELATQVLKISQSSRQVIARSLNLLADIAFDERKYSEAREQVTAALQIFHEIGSQDDAAVAATLLARIDYIEGNLTQARELAAHALSIKQETGNQHGIAVSLNLLAKIEYADSNFAAAKELALRSLEIEEEIGNRDTVAGSLNLLASIEFADGNFAQSRELAEQALRLWQEFGDREGVANSLQALSRIAAVFKLPEDALGLSILAGAYRNRGQSSSVTQRVEEAATPLITALYQQVSEAYMADGGKALIEIVLERLREADASPG